MQAIGFAAYLAAIALAWVVATHRRGRRVAVAAVVAFALLYGAPLLVRWLVQGDVRPWRSAREVHFGIVGAYALTIALIPSGLLRPFAHRPWAPLATLALAAVSPVACILVATWLGSLAAPVRSGWGNVFELLFLDPTALGDGIRGDGFITPRFRVHCVALALAVLVGLALQWLPRGSAGEGGVGVIAGGRRAARARPAEQS